MDIEQARFNMIEQQIRTWEVLDQSVLDLLNEVHREVFVPDSYKELAFADIRIPLDHNQTMMSPKVEARILQTLALKESDIVLEVGTGSGYLTALMAKQANHVTSVDYYADFIETSNTKLLQHGFTNIELVNNDVYQMLDSDEQYDVLVLTGSLPMMDKRFLDLVKTQGRMLVLIGESPVMEACLITKHDNDSWSHESLFESDLPALIGAVEQEQFQF